MGIIVGTLQPILEIIYIYMDSNQYNDQYWKTYIYILYVYIYYIYMDINIGWLIIIVGTLQTFLGDSQDSVGKSGHWFLAFLRRSHLRWCSLEPHFSICFSYVSHTFLICLTSPFPIFCSCLNQHPFPMERLRSYRDLLHGTGRQFFSNAGAFGHRGPMS